MEERRLGRELEGKRSAGWKVLGEHVAVEGHALRQQQRGGEGRGGGGEDETRCKGGGVMRR